MSRQNGKSPTVDAVLERFARTDVPAGVERRLEARLQEFCRHPQTSSQPQSQPERVLPNPSSRIPRRFVRASVAAGVAAMAAVALFVAFGHRDAWAQVAKAMRSKPWVRWTFQLPHGMPAPEGFQAPEAWFSADKKVFARRAMNRAAQFIDLAGQETYDYMPETKTLIRSLTNDVDNVEVEHFEMLLRLVAEGDVELKVPESPIQIVGRTRRDVPDGERRWTEYAFSCRDSRHTVKDYQVTFRVDPRTQLPVEMRSTEKFSPNDPAVERTYAIDYPETGPGDIYALGAPRDAKVVDRHVARIETAREVKEFLAAYIKARSKPIEPFSTTVLQSDPKRDFSDISTAIRGNDGGDETRVEQVDHEQLMEFRQKIWKKTITRPADSDKLVWWKEQVEEMKFAPMPRGDEFLPHRIGYPVELMGFGASPVDNPDCRVTLERQPAFGPPGTVLLKIRIETTVGFNDCYFWIAPERDYLVLRHEIYYSKDHAPWNNSTQIIDETKQSPGGRWYATAVRNGRIEKHGDDLSAEQVLATNKPETEMGPVTTLVYRYLVDFK